jgi:hypothetical protein
VKIGEKYLITLDRPSTLYVDGELNYDDWGDTIGVPSPRSIQNQLALLKEIRVASRDEEYLFYFPNLDITQALTILAIGERKVQLGWNAVHFLSVEYNRIWTSLNG